MKKINWKELLLKRPTCKNCNTYSWTITIMLAGLLFMVWAYQHDTGYERLMECNDRYQELSKHVNLVNPPYIGDGFPGYIETPFTNGVVNDRYNYNTTDQPNMSDISFEFNGVTVDTTESESSDRYLEGEFNDFYKEDEDPYNCLITHCRDENIWVIDITDASQVIRFKNEVFVESELE